MKDGRWLERNINYWQFSQLKVKYNNRELMSNKSKDVLTCFTKHDN